MEKPFTVNNSVLATDTAMLEGFTEDQRLARKKFLRS